MRKFLLFISAIALLISAGAPEAHAQFFKMGVKGGLLINSQNLQFTRSANTFDRTSTRAGFEAGLQFTLKIPLSPLIIQPEFVYTRITAHYNTGSQNFGVVKLRSNSFDVPVLLGVKFSALRVMAGPVFTFPTTDIISTDILNEKFAPRYKDFLMGLQVGAGIDIGRVTLDARYHWAFNSLTDEFRVLDSGTNLDIRNGRFAFSVGYTIFKLL